MFYHPLPCREGGALGLGRAISLQDLRQSEQVPRGGENRRVAPSWLLCHILISPICALGPRKGPGLDAVHQQLPVVLLDPSRAAARVYSQVHSPTVPCDQNEIVNE